MTKLKALFSLTGAAVIVGSTLVISKIISKGESIYCLQFISMLIASLALAVLIGKNNLKDELKRVKREDYKLFILQTLTGVVLFRVFIIYGVKLTKAVDAGIILSLTPIITVLLSIIFLREKPSKFEIFALISAFLGVLIINLNGVYNGGTTGHRIIGNLMVLLAVLGECTFVICSKKASSDISSMMRSLMICLCAVILFFPLACFEIISNYTFIYSFEFWIVSFYSGLILTVLAYILWFKGIKYVSGTTAGIFNTLIPVSAIVLVFIFLGEKINSSQLLGLSLILLGVAAVIYSNSRETVNILD